MCGGLQSTRSASGDSIIPTEDRTAEPPTVPVVIRYASGAAPDAVANTSKGPATFKPTTSSCRTARTVPLVISRSCHR